MQQSARPGVRLLVVDRDEGDLEDGVREIGVHGETGETRPNVLVGHLVLMGVVPSVGDVQRLNGVDAAVVGNLVEVPGLTSARSADPVDSAELNGLERGVLSAMDGGVHFRIFLPGRLGCSVGMGMLSPVAWLAQAPGGGAFCHIVWLSCDRWTPIAPRHRSHMLGVDGTTHRPSTIDAPPEVGARRREDARMGSTVDEGMLVQHMDVRRVAKPSDDSPARFTIMIEHMDGTNYMVSVADKKETPEHLMALLANVARGADTMIRALDILRAIGYVDMRPVALLGREIVFGLDRVSLELEIIENGDGEIECGISVAGVNVENVEEIGGVLEENGIDLI